MAILLIFLEDIAVRKYGSPQVFEDSGMLGTRREVASFHFHLV